jgi:hypothetical protein
MRPEPDQPHRIESADETFTIGGFATAAGSDISLSDYPSFLTG